MLSGRRVMCSRCGMAVRAVIFDIGNVLLPFDYMRAVDRLVAANAPPVPPDRGRVTAAQRDLELGLIDEAEFFLRVAPEFNHRGPDAEFLAIWADIFEPNPPLFSLAEHLAATMPLYLLSNTNSIHRRHFEHNYPVFGLFRDAIYSYEAGLLKPDPAIFALPAARFGINPGDTLYLDDMPENVAAARQAGFHTIHYLHHDHARAEAEILALAGV
jgi:glucose-1-phosphatase